MVRAAEEQERRLRHYFRLGAVLVTAAVCLAQTSETGAVNRTIVKAKRVLVTTMRGPDADAAQIPPGDQRAVDAVEQELRRWKRYELTRTREDADLIMVVRKASGVGVSWGDPRLGPDVSRPAVNNPSPVTADSLAVFDAHGLGMEAPPLWTASEPGGLNPPEMKLLKKFRKRVEEAEKRP